MNKAINISSLFTGKTQMARQLPALDPSFFAIDERDTADLLAFTVKFSKALTYFDLDNQPQGTWQQLLLSDIVMLTAYIMKTDQTQAYAKYEDYRNGIQASRNWPMRRLLSQQYFSIGFHIILRINRWYQLSNQTLTNHVFRDFLHDFIEDEGKQALREYYLIYFTLCERLKIKNEALSKLEDLDLIWFFDPFPELPPLKVPSKKRESLAKLNARKEKLFLRLIQAAMDSGQKLFQLQQKVIKHAGIYFQQAIQQQNISPHIGLLLTFLNLLKYQQADINGLTKSHLDFYYKDILGFSALPPLADTCFLNFQLAKGQEAYLLPAGTAFVAGTTSQSNPIVFLTEKELDVTAATIKKYQCQNLITYQKEGKTFVEQVEIEDVTQFSQLQAASWPLFGTRKSKPGISPNAAASRTLASQAPGSSSSSSSTEMGLAISCPDLILNGGERHISFSIGGSTSSTVSRATVGTRSTVDADKCQPEEKPLQTLLQFALTTTKGWSKFSPTTLQLNQKANTLAFTLDLEQSAPSIIAYNTKLHGKGYDTTWPICKITLAKGVEEKYVKWLSELQMNTLTISTQVEGLQQIVLQGDKGKISPTVPFPPFGMAPTPQSTLYIGGQEFFVKPLQALDLNLIWEPIPFDLASYYKDYPGDYNNENFKADFSTLDTDGEWKVLETGAKQLRFPLFTSPEAKSVTIPGLDSIVPIVNPRKINFPLAKILQADPDLAPITNFSAKTSHAFFKLTFVDPEQAFGNAIYPKVLSTITLENSQAIVSNATQCQLEGAIEPIANSLKEVDSALSQVDAISWSVFALKYQLQAMDEEICQLIRKEGGNASQTITTVKALLAREEKSLTEDLQSVEKTLEEAIQKAEKELTLFFGKTIPKLQAMLKRALKKKITKTTKLYLEKMKFEFTAWHFIHEIERMFQNLFSRASISNFEKFLKNLVSRKQPPPALPAGASSPPVSKLPKLTKKIEELQEQYANFLKKLVQTPIENLHQEVVSFHENIDAELQEFNQLIDKQVKRKLTHIKTLFEEVIVMICPAYTALKPLPNKPFLPKLKQLKVDYKAESNWTAHSDKTPFFKLFQLNPQGIQSIAVAKEPLPFFPTYPKGPHTFLGLVDVQAGDNLSLLFSITSQLKLISAKVTKSIKYEYLTDQGWNNLLTTSDSTYGFEQSGIVSFIIPDDMTDTSTIMPTGYYWLRLTNLEGRKIMTNFVATQAVQVRRQVQVDSQIATIPIGTIKSSLKPIAAIKKVSQPIASSGGRNAESDTELYQRTAYRLKNKQRAITPSDVEDLVLQQFGNLYKATAVPMGYLDKSQSDVLKVTIVPFTRQQSENRFRPLVSPEELRRIWNQLNSLLPNKTKLELVNPNFRTIRIKIDVTFQSTDQNGTLSKQLNEDVINYLSPWIVESPFYGQQPSQWTAANLHAFIQSRPTVKELSYFCYQLDGKPSFTNEDACPAPAFEELLKPGDLLVPSLDNVINSYDVKEDAGNPQKSTITKIKTTSPN